MEIEDYTKLRHYMLKPLNQLTLDELRDLNRILNVRSNEVIEEVKKRKGGKYG